MPIAANTTKHENIILFMVAWSIRSRLRSEQVLRPTQLRCPCSGVLPNAQKCPKSGGYSGLKKVDKRTSILITLTFHAISLKIFWRLA